MNRESKRRNFLKTTALSSLSLAGAHMLLGNEALAASKMSSSKIKQDLAVLNTALALEHEGIMAYQLGAESGLLKKDILKVAVSFQNHHKGHRETLIKTIKSLGGTAVGEKPRKHYEKSLNASSLKSQSDILQLARKLEMGAISAYIGVIETFSSEGLQTAASKLIADEVMHWTVLTQVLGKKLPTKAFTFG